MLLVLMVTSKGMAGVPRASLVVIAATLAQFNIPEAGLLLLLGIDHFLDMARSATNVIGNSVATAVVSKWEGQLRSEADLRLPCPDCQGIRRGRVTRICHVGMSAGAPRRSLGRIGILGQQTRIGGINWSDAARLFAFQSFLPGLQMR